MEATIEYLEEMRIIETFKLTKGTKVDVISRVDGLRNAVDRMRNREASPQCGTILHIVDTKMNFTDMRRVLQ